MEAFFILVAAILVLDPGIRVLSQQPGFLSIDCGLEANGNYRDTSGIDYVPDGQYVDSGENHVVAPEYQSEYQSEWQERSYLTLRSFPSATGERNCYSLPTRAGDKYLVRVEIFYGNYDGKNSSSSLGFDLYLGPDYWAAFNPDVTVYEALFVAWAAWTPVCLVNIGRGTPFVSAIELRPLAAELYPPVTPALSLSFYVRRSMGATTTPFIRVPTDRYDRYWWPMREASSRWTNISTEQVIQPDPKFVEPLSVMQTAIEAAGNATVLTVRTWTESNTGLSFMAFLHFADFQDAQLRQFDIYFNGNRLGNSSHSPSPLIASCVYSSAEVRADDGRYNITLVSTAKSVKPPMINAYEIYTLIPHKNPKTFSQDIDAIMAIKFEYGVKKNWTGDPCYPAKWYGVKCSNMGDNTTRITSLDLSNSNLRGTISTKFTLLTALENLDISYNNLSGSIPNSLPSLSSLRVLNLSGNHLNGNSLCKNYSGSLILRYDSNQNTCNQIASSRKRAVVLITSVVVSVVVMAALFLVYFIWRAKRKPTVSIDDHDHARNIKIENVPRSRKDQGDHLQDTENRRFTYKDLEKFTDNFKQFIGKGGFGLVYYGCLEDGTEVAVKLRSESSSHGLDEFLAEVQSLTKVHHRNLVSLVGYCWEQDHLALVYEYMSQGNLNDHLIGKNGAAETLTWGTRLRVLLEAAQGLDYLHKGCNPPIIHRDVKSSNILLGQNLQAKIADLGLSRTYLSDAQTHISATAAGTPGFMDPEYYLTGRLTECSDVYSFGVVLLEAITGEPPMVPGLGHIIQRVKKRIAMGDIDLVADRRLGGAYDVNSMWKVADTALMCTADAGAVRPTMAEVVAQLKDSLALEDARESECSHPASLAASETATLVSTFGPMAR